MAIFSALGEKSRHVRAESLPSLTHPLTAHFHQELNMLKACAAEPSSPTSTPAHVLCSRVQCLTSMYDSVHDLLQMAHTQRALACHSNEKCVEEELDGSLRLVDMCGISRDNLSIMKEQLRDVKSALRTRRGSNSMVQSKIRAYAQLAKTSKKEAEKCSKTLKQIDGKCGVCSLHDKDHDLSAVLMSLKEVRFIAITAFHSIFAFMSSSTPKMKSKTIDCEEMQHHLEALEFRIDGLESGLELLYRRLIRVRVSLLNIINV